MYHRSDHEDNDKYRSKGPGSSYFSSHSPSQSSPLAGYSGIEGQKKEEKKKEEQWNNEKIREKYAKKDDARDEKRKDDSDHHKKQQESASWDKKGLATLDDAIDAAAKDIGEAIEKEKKAIRVR